MFFCRGFSWIERGFYVVLIQQHSQGTSWFNNCVTMIKLQISSNDQLANFQKVAGAGLGH